MEEDLCPKDLLAISFLVTGVWSWFNLLEFIPAKENCTGGSYSACNDFDSISSQVLVS